MRVLIRYLLHGEKVARQIALSSEEYFDDSEGDIALDLEGDPKHPHAYQYLPHDAEDLCWTVLEIRHNAAYWRVRTQFLKGNESMMIHSQKSDGSEEIIHQAELCTGCWQTVRTRKDPGKSWTVVLSQLTVVGSGGLLPERDYCGRWSFGELEAFGDV